MTLPNPSKQAENRQRLKGLLLEGRFFVREDVNKPENRAENRFAADVVAVLDDLRIGRTHYWGYSMGGLIGFALGDDAPERFTTINGRG